MTVGIKISKPGFDVKTCNDEDLVMSSEFNMLKTKMVGKTSTSVAHGLAYIPVYFAMEVLTDGVNEVGTFVGSGTSSGQTFSYCDTTNFYAGANTTKYYIFYQESA